MEIIERGLSFGQALVSLIDFEQADGIRLPHWKEDVIVKVHHPLESDDMTHPYLYVESRYGTVPWKETVVEMFSRNWETVRI